MKMYVANCTRQAQDFIYRLPERPAPMMQRIEVGTQIMLSGDLSTPEIEYIVQQHRKYGMVDVKEVDHTKAFIGTCYSIDKPVQIGKVQFAINHNTDVLVERGRVQRQEAAVAINQQLDEATGGRALTETDVSIVEEKGPNGDTPTFGEGVIVRKDVPAGESGSRVSRPRGGRRG